MLSALIALLLTGCGPSSESGPTTRIDGDDLLLFCPDAGEPVRVRVPGEAVVQTYVCEDDGERCVTVDHALADGVVEVSCRTSTARPRRIRWVSPVR